MQTFLARPLMKLMLRASTSSRNMPSLLLFLIRGTDQEWNILNLDPDTFEKWYQTNANEFEVVGFGGGVYLVHKVDK